MTVPVIKKVLVTTDLSEFSVVGLEYASAIYGLLDVELYLLHVVDRGHRDKASKKAKETKGTRQEREATTLRQLSLLAGRYLSGCGTIHKVVRRGEPYKEIVKFSNSEKIDLIIISTHGRTGLSHVLLGSVAERVVRLASVPVLTVKPETIQMQLMKQEDIDEQLHLKLADNS